MSYYIRSSVLGGEVVSQTNATGRKAKTYVRAAGATLAWQTAYFNPTNNTQSEYVNYEHRDASGLSYRSTTPSGETIYGEGGEGAPAELDPLGGNVGLSTPYQQEEIIEPPPPENPSLRNLFEDSPMYVNGQRVTATLDGMEVPLSVAMNALRNGSAIPAELARFQSLPGFRFEDRGLGIFTGTVFDRVRIPNANFGAGDIRVNGYTNAWLPRDVSFYFPVSWSSQPQTRQDDRSLIITIPLKNEENARNLLKNPGCATFINDLVKKTAEKFGRAFANDTTLSPTDYLLNNLDKIKFNDGAFYFPNGDRFPLT